MQAFFRIHPLAYIASASFLLSLTGCQPATPVVSVAPTSAAAPFTTPIALQDAMQSLIDPSADALWDAVSTTVTKKGEERQEPKTDEDWNALKLHTLRVIAGASLLQSDGLRVVRDGVKIEDTHETYLNEAGIAAAIAKDPAAFKAAAAKLESAAQEVLVTVNRRDIEGLFTLGAKLDSACEQCHSTFWYPNQVLPTWPAQKDAKK